ncbi:polynucleotidyl transferase, ribonuclease H-like superfamily protein [Actinidia rufa]|uniref:Polynucleotidyl transferase, ribonuclease H-like superfamily protein n=1 Tax=Actinidia rufa TaxID=165716 RepID=A0A7J0FSX7_9ERIC|nr:polynucleotidyl transferase, ribonuclease H-like superfamily protein [Actinidia rufa]
MNQLANAFSVLELDVADERTATVVAADHRENANGIGKGKKKGDSLGDMTLIKNDNGVQQGLDIVSGKYKLPLVWIDLEMTGRTSAVNTPTISKSRTNLQGCSEGSNTRMQNWMSTMPYRASYLQSSYGVNTMQKGAHNRGSLTNCLPRVVETE